MSLTKLSLVSDIPAEDGKIDNLFLQCGSESSRESREESSEAKSSPPPAKKTRGVVQSIPSGIVATVLKLSLVHIFVQGCLSKGHKRGRYWSAKIGDICL